MQQPIENKLGSLPDYDSQHTLAYYRYSGGYLQAHSQSARTDNIEVMKTNKL